MIHEVVVRGIAVSSANKGTSYGRWKARVAEAAREAIPIEERLEFEAVQVVVVQYCFDWNGGDLDNIAGAILDGLSGPAYSDDQYVTELILRRTELGSDPIDVVDPPPRLADALEEAYRDREDFVYVRISPETDHRRLPWRE